MNTLTRAYRILIAEDDALISEELKHELEDFGHQVVSIVSDMKRFKDALNYQPDLVFLDVRMHGEDLGFQMAKYLNDHTQIPFLFLTSFGDAETVMQASSLQPSAYLVKPFKSADIYSTLEIAMAKVRAGKKETIEIKDGTKTHLIQPDDILFVKADNVYVEVTTISKKILERITLDKFSERLPNQFQKCHRSYLVNTHLIESKSNSYVTIKNHKIPVSRTYKSQL